MLERRKADQSLLRKTDLQIWYLQYYITVIIIPGSMSKYTHLDIEQKVFLRK
ncbi:hypothetical protein [Cyclobacterium salsum]|uniref:hypothetical protein n=1 Tax=Cyclobacterium salsum TaxID=2666329 RepID=UPI0013920F75|nr:hypothetical protein [Cyclobacterium salsum]